MQQQRTDGGEPSAPATPGLLLLSYTTPRDAASDAAGYEKETNHDAVMERVDAEGHVIGFSIMGVSQFSKDKPFEADLVSA